jgi:hypothetical protein
MELYCAEFEMSVGSVRYMWSYIDLSRTELTNLEHVGNVSSLPDSACPTFLQNPHSSFWMIILIIYHFLVKVEVANYIQLSTISLFIINNLAINSIHWVNSSSGLKLLYTLINLVFYCKLCLLVLIII